MANRNAIHILKNTLFPSQVLPASAYYGEPLVNLGDGIVFFSGSTDGSPTWVPSNNNAGYFEVGSNLYNLKIRNKITHYNNLTNLAGKFLSGTTTGFVLADITNIQGVDNYVTGGTYSNGTLTLNRQNGSVTVNGLLSADTYVTGFTYSNNNLTIQQNQGQSPLSVNISTMTGLTVNGTVSATTYAGETTNFGLSLDGQSGIISTGQKGYTIIPYNITITGWNIVASPSGSCQFDVWKIASGSALPTVSNTITGSQKPILSNGYIATSTSVSGWTTTVTTGDIIGYNVDSASGITKVTLSINGTKR